MPREFAITFDYRCPYARIAHDHVVTALRGGADWNVRFVPFSLAQAHAEPGDPDGWGSPETDSGLLALQVSIVVRDHFPESFLALHHAMFEHRHAAAGNLREREPLAEVMRGVGLDPDAVFAVVDGGTALATIRDEHVGFARSHEVWGVPTFVVGDDAVFVRLLDRADGDTTLATVTVERILDQIEWPILNEFKHTSVPR